MSKHNIHGLIVDVRVYQGNLTETARGRCIGKIVNLCRDMRQEDFVQCMGDITNSLQGSAKSAAMLATLDNALAANYTKRYKDEFAPIASLKLVNG